MLKQAQVEACLSPRGTRMGPTKFRLRAARTGGEAPQPAEWQRCVPVRPAEPVAVPACPWPARGVSCKRGGRLQSCSSARDLSRDLRAAANAGSTPSAGPRYWWGMRDSHFLKQFGGYERHRRDSWSLFGHRRAQVSLCPRNWAQTRAEEVSRFQSGRWKKIGGGAERIRTAE